MSSQNGTGYIWYILLCLDLLAMEYNGSSQFRIKFTERNYSSFEKKVEHFWL